MELQEALSAAIAFEHRVRDYYAKCAKRIPDPTGKKVFETLTKEEQGHVDYLESRLAEWKRTATITDSELPSLLPPPAWIKQEAKKIAAACAHKKTEPTAEIDLLKEALESERQATAFYQNLITQTGEKYRHLFERFLEIEDGHTLIVQAEIDSLAGHGHWFDFMEFSLEHS